jgi:hypothetical protein
MISGVQPRLAGRDRRAVFRDIGTHAFYNYLGWANPTAFNHPVHFARAKMKKGK